MKTPKIYNITAKFFDSSTGKEVTEEEWYKIVNEKNKSEGNKEKK